MNLKSRAKQFCIVINEKAPNELEAIEDKLNDCAIFNFYALIIHDKDTLSNGNLKTKHLHLYGEKTSQIALETLLNELCDKLSLNKEQISIDKTTNNFLYIQYLTHKNDPNKYQYDIKEIKTNNEAEFLSRYSMNYKKPVTEEEIFEHLKVDVTLGELINNIGLSNAKKFLSIYDRLQNSSYQKLTHQELASRVQELEECIKELYEVIYSHYGFKTVEEADQILTKYGLIK